MASASARTRKVHFEVLSMTGNKIGSYDLRDRALQFRNDRHERGIRVKLAKVTTITEEME